MTNGSEHAFPNMHISEGKVSLEGGISKREYFAAMAMQAIAANEDLNYSKADYERGDHLAGSKAVAKFSVFYADALLAELAKEQK